MSEEPTPYATGTATTPPGWNDTPRPKRNGYKGMLPSTWLNREVRLEYVGANGKPANSTGLLLDWYPFGPVLCIEGARTLLCWDRICLLELKEETR